MQLMRDLSLGRFSILIVMAPSRLGRETIETPFLLKRIHKAGVRVFSYLNSQEIYTAKDKMFFAFQAHVPSPSAKAAGWLGSIVREEVLHRPLNDGVLAWNRTKKRDN